MKRTDEYYFAPGWSHCAPGYIDADGVLYPAHLTCCALSGPHPHARALELPGVIGRLYDSPHHDARPGALSVHEQRALETGRLLVQAAAEAHRAFMAMRHAAGKTVDQADQAAAEDVSRLLERAAVDLRRAAKARQREGGKR